MTYFIPSVKQNPSN